MKKWLKILLIVVASVVAFVFILSVLFGPIAKNYIEKNSKTLCNRTVTMDKLRVNLFAGKCTVKGFVMMEEDDTQPFVSFQSLKVKIAIPRLLAKTVRINEITLDEPVAAIVQHGAAFNFDDLISFFSNDDTTSKEPSKWEIDLRNISINKGDFCYKDEIVHSNIGIKELSLHIPRLFFSNQSSDVGIHLAFADGGTLGLKMLYSMNAGQYKLKFNLDKLAIDIIKPYLDQSFFLGDVKGLLSANLVVVGNTEHIAEFALNGTVKLDKVSVKDIKQNEFVALHEFNCKVHDINLKENRFYFDSISVNGLKVHYDQYADASTITTLFKNNEPDTLHADSTKINDNGETDKSSAPMDFLISSFSLHDGAFFFTDHSLKKEPLELTVSQINLNAKELSDKTASSVSLSALVGNGGNLSVNWHGMLSDLSNMTLNVDLNNFIMSDISPYCIHYLGYPLKEGVLSFKSTNSIKNNYLNGNNKLDLFKCKVDNKEKGFKPVYNIPLKAALYILTDRKGKIMIDLPVKGNIDSPDFSFRKILFKTFMNLIVKVVASPIDFIVNAVDANKDVFSSFSTTLADNTFSSSEYARLNDMVNVLKEKNQLLLSIQPSFNETDFITDGRMIDTAAVTQQMTLKATEYHNLLKNYFSTQGIAADRIVIHNFDRQNKKRGSLLLNFTVTMPEEQDENSHYESNEPDRSDK